LGKTVHKLIHKFPRIEILAYAQPITRSCLRIDLQLTPDFQWDEKMHGRSEPFHIFILDCDCERILYSEQFALKYKRVVQSDSKNYSFSFTVPLFEIMHPIYFIKVVSDRWMQCESEQAIPFKNLILPEPFSRVTELLGRSPLPIEAIQYPNIETALKKKVLPLGTTHFDSV
jgi:pre-mRNA-splicing helicase BRR2